MRSLHSVLAADVSAEHLTLAKGSNSQRNRKLEASRSELVLLFKIVSATKTGPPGMLFNSLLNNKHSSWNIADAQ